MDGHVCPFCKQAFFVDDNVRNDKLIFLRSKADKSDAMNCKKFIVFYWYICPLCDKIDLSYRLRANGNNDLEGKIGNEYFKFSDIKYIPEQIIEDYKEAAIIVNLSPKASATLSRRCLQGIIRDFWGIKNKKSLMQEIDSIPQNEISEKERDALHALRSIGNIGAHPEKTNAIVDIEENEAKKMLKLVEFFIENWYVRRHEQELMLDEIKEIFKEKENIRNSYSNNNISNSNNVAFGENSTAKTGK